MIHFFIYFIIKIKTTQLKQKYKHIYKYDGFQSISKLYISFIKIHVETKYISFIKNTLFNTRVFWYGLCLDRYNNHIFCSFFEPTASQPVVDGSALLWSLENQMEADMWVASRWHNL